MNGFKKINGLRILKNLKFDMDYINSILIVIVLIVFIVCCFKKKKEITDNKKIDRLNNDFSKLEFVNSLFNISEDFKNFKLIN